jgi:hypothetical protein
MQLRGDIMTSSNHKVSIVVGVKDLASSSLRGIQNTMNHMGKGFGSANNFLGAFGRNLDSVIGRMDKMSKSLMMFNMHTAALQRNLRNITMIGGAVVGGLAIQGTNKALDYDYKTRVMQSRMETNNGVRKNVSDYILNDLTYKTSYKPTDLADIGILLGQGGINNSKDMKSMLKTTAYFSEAVDAVPQDAAEMVIAAAKGFNISMQNSSQITDKLTIALNKSLLQTEELPHAIGELAGRANMYGQSLDSSLVALMTMRDQGMSAAQGSQDFLHAMTSASKIGNDDVLYKRTRGYFSSLGVTDAIFNKDTRQLKEFPDLIADMEKAMISKGFINPKYRKEVKDEKGFKDYLGKNGGVAPKDFWDSQKAMPLISKVFGAAGTAPILMGLQSKYDEIGKDGEKTGKVYYGSDALKEMFKDVKHSDGAVDKTHDIIAQSGKFQLNVLSGAWESAQIKLLDGIVPLIKTGAEQLTRNFSPPTGGNKKFGNLNAENYEYESPIQKFRKSLEETVTKFKEEGHTTTAQVVNTLGNGVINGVEISKTLPSTAKQIGSAANKNLIKADWGDNLIEFPWHIVKNGISFIKDIFKANKEFDDAVKKLPKDLQDPAKLVATLVKGGIALMVTGAVIKVIELGVRGVSLAMKGTKIATSLTQSILGLFTGNKGKGNVLSEILGKNMAIKANIVNVYGATVNGGGGVPGGAGGVPPVVATGTSFGSKALSALKWGGYAVAIAGAVYILTHPKEVNQAISKNPVQKQVEKLGPKTDKKVDEMSKILKDPSKYKGPKKPGETQIVPESNFFKPTPAPKGTSGSDLTSGRYSSGSWDAVKKDLITLVNKISPEKVNPKEKEANNQKIMDFAKEGTANINTSILDGFSQANNKLQNIKLNNALSIIVQPPQVNVTGVPQAKVTTSGSTSFTKREGTNTGETAWDRKNAIMQRRLGWR